jgi:cytochrome c-type biogenesis protein
MMDLATQFQTLSAASIAAFLLVAAAGLLMGVAPSSLPMYSVVVGSVAARSGRPTGPRRALLFALGFVLGLPFGFSTCPACTPMTLPILAAAAATGSLWLGAALMFAFGLARGAPLLVAAVATDLVKLVARVAPVLPRIERAGAVLVLLAAAYFFYLSAFQAGLAPAIDWLLSK